MDEGFKSRVQERLDALKLSANKAAELGGFQRHYVSDIVNGRKKSIGADRVAQLAGVLETTVSYLMYGSDEPDIPGEVQPNAGRLVPVFTAGTVEAGAFRIVDDVDDIEPLPLFEARDRDFPDARLVAYDVAGDSMNNLKPRPILPGDRIICVSYEDVAGRLPLRDGMVVVVERTRDGGLMREWSVKQLELYEGRTEFHPRSTNPRHKPIVVRRDADADDGSEVSIICIVRRITNDVPVS